MTEQLANTIIPEDERIFICIGPKKGKFKRFIYSYLKVLLDAQMNLGI